ncbi:metallophosphoesterase [uncultured Sphingomonas sp.]|uniref:metallophosphoesterase n=1 Tax=uncultured Sphingomonas sp. TaxID=158754 RepID=UPI0025F52883|nr:metallophosphoesterase [uncultured Sphingomonas sp.]
MRRRLLLLLTAVIVLGAAAFAAGVWNARVDPVVRTARVGLRDWPAGAAPVRAAVLSDIHIGSIAMDEARLSRIVAQVNALHPDIVLIAGDLINGYGAEDALKVEAPLTAALSRLRAPLGVVAVPGNHDHGTSIAAVRAALTRAGVTVLANQALRRGPLAIGGVDDDYSRADNLPATMAGLRSIGGAAVLLTHSPDLATKLPAAAPFMIAGHTHCGQVRLPVIGPPILPVRTHKRYLCGMIDDRGHQVLVTAGLGTSDLPVRWRAPPDLWLLTLGPAR